MFVTIESQYVIEKPPASLPCHKIVASKMEITKVIFNVCISQVASLHQPPSFKQLQRFCLYILELNCNVLACLPHDLLGDLSV